MDHVVDKMRVRFEKQVRPKLKTFIEQLKNAQQAVAQTKQELNDVTVKATASATKIKELQGKLDAAVLADEDIHGTSTAIHTEQSKAEAYNRHAETLRDKLDGLIKDMEHSQGVVNTHYNAEIRVLRTELQTYAYDKLVSYFEMIIGWRSMIKSLSEESLQDDGELLDIFGDVQAIHSEHELPDTSLGIHPHTISFCKQFREDKPKLSA